MNVLVAAVTFLAGMLLGTRLLAGLYSVIDLWYTIRTAWPTVLRRVLGWSSITTVVLFLLSSGWRWVFVAGMAAHVLGYVVAMFMIAHTGKRTLEPTPIVD